MFTSVVGQGENILSGFVQNVQMQFSSLFVQEQGLNIPELITKFVPTVPLREWIEVSFTSQMFLQIFSALYIYKYSLQAQVADVYICMYGDR